MSPVPSPRALALRSTLLVATLVAAACQETPVALPEATTIRLSSDSVSLSVGESVQLNAQVLDQKERVMLNTAATWTSSNVNVARVNAMGILTAFFPATATLTASFGAASATMTVRVLQPVIEAQPAALMMLTGQTQAVSTTIRSTAGADLSALSPITYESLDRGVATIGSTGAVQTVTAIAEGSAKVVARALTVTDTIYVTVVRNAAQLVTLVNIIPDSVASFVGLAAADPAMQLDFTATDTNGVNRCGLLPAVSFRTNGAVAVGAVVNPCQIRITPIGIGSTYLVAQVNNARDSVLVRVVGAAASVVILADSTTGDQSTVAAQRNQIQFRILDPRGVDNCVGLQGAFALTTRNATLAAGTIVNAPQPCRIRIDPGTAPTAQGMTYLVLSNGEVADSIAVRMTSVGMRFRDNVFQTVPVAGTILTAGSITRLGAQVVDRANVPQPNVRVFFTATTPGINGSTGTLDKSLVVTDANGRAEVDYTAPGRLSPTGGAGSLTQAVTVVAEAVGPQGQAVAAGGGTQLLAPLVVGPGLAARIALVRTITPAPLVPNDTLSSFASASIANLGGLHIGQRSDSIEARAFDRFGNRVVAAVRLTTSTQEPATIDLGAVGATVNGVTPSVNGQLISVQSRAPGTITITARQDTASTSLPVTTGPTSSIVWTTGANDVVTGSPYVDVASPTRTAYNAGGTVTMPQFTAVRDTVAFVRTDLGNRTFIVPADGSRAGTALVAAGGITSVNSFAAAPVFLTQAGTRGTVLFISDSVGGFTRIYRRAAGSAAVTLLVDNLDRSIVFRALALSNDEAELLVATARFLDDGVSGTDSSKSSNLYRYRVADGIQTAAVTNNTDFTRDVRILRPTYSNAGTPVFERYDAAPNSTQLVTADAPGLRTITTIGGLVELQASFDPTTPSQYAFLVGGTLMVAPPGRPTFNARGGLVQFAWTRK